jgi:hypothetical protein
MTSDIVSPFPAILCVFLIAAACEHTSPMPASPPAPGPALSEAASVASTAGQGIDQSAARITVSAHSVKTHAETAEIRVPPTARRDLATHLTIIKSEADNILSEAEAIRAAGIDVSKLAVSLQGLALNVQTLTDRSIALEDKVLEGEEQNKELQDQLGQAQSDKNAALRRAMLYMVLAGSIIIAICVTLFFTGNPKAIGGAIAGIVLISVAMAVMAVTKYMWLFGIVGSIGAVVVLAVMIYHIVDYIRHKRGLQEVVETSEYAKSGMPTDLREQVYGPEGEAGRAGQLQSSATEQLVKSIKTKLRTS